VAALLFTACSTPSPGPHEARFRYRVIDENGPYEMHIVSAGDVNRDGQIDVLAAGTDGNIFWYEAPSWKKHTIATQGGGWSTEAQVGDIDLDGDNDLVISDWYQNKRIVWFENVGNDRWTLHPIGGPHAHDVKLADLDNDGDLDVVTRSETFESAEGHTIEIWIQDKPDAWRHFTLPVPPGEGLALADVDRDKDLDILIGGRWYENTGNVASAAWPEHVYSVSWVHAAAFPFLADVYGDGTPDIVLTPSKPQDRGRYRISWFEGTANPKGIWPEHIVADNVESLQHSIFVGDINGDGSADIVTAEMHQSADPDEVVVYLNDGGKAARWKKQVLVTTGSHFLRVADIGGDGDLDLVGANWSGTRKVELWENLSKDK
jgi:hypothetical protein